MGTQKTIIYRLVITNFGFGSNLTLSIFFGPGKGRGPTGTHMSLGPQNPTKKLTHWVDLLGHLLSIVILYLVICIRINFNYFVGVST